MLFHPTRFLDLNTTLDRMIILNGCKLEALNRLLTTSIVLDSFPSFGNTTYCKWCMAGGPPPHPPSAKPARWTTTPLRGKSDRWKANFNGRV